MKELGDLYQLIAPEETFPEPEGTPESEAEADRWLEEWLEGRTPPLTYSLRVTLWLRWRAVFVFLRNDIAYGAVASSNPDRKSALRALLVEVNPRLVAMLRTQEAQKN